MNKDFFIFQIKILVRKKKKNERTPFVTGLVMARETGHGEIDLNNDEKGAAPSRRKDPQAAVGWAGSTQKKRQRISDIPTPTITASSIYTDYYLGQHDKTTAGYNTSCTL